MQPDRRFSSYNNKQAGNQKSTMCTQREFGTPLPLNWQNSLPMRTLDMYEDWKNHEEYLSSHMNNILRDLAPKDYLSSLYIIKQRGNPRRLDELIEISAKLMDWSTKHKFSDNTYFLARFLALKAGRNDNLGLAVCLFIADKYEEYHAQTWDTHIKQAGISASMNDVFSVELDILARVNFCVYRPRIHYLLIQALKSLRKSKDDLNLANDLLKLILIDEKMFTYPVDAALAAIFRFLAMTTKDPQLEEDLKKNIDLSRVDKDKFISAFQCIKQLRYQLSSHNKNLQHGHIRALCKKVGWI